MLQKGCECREGKMEEWKRNWDEVFMGEVRRERNSGKREREKVKCHEMFGNTK
jgi:hypothetical protein